MRHAVYMRIIIISLALLFGPIFWIHANEESAHARTVEFSLEEITQAALRSNFDIQLAKYDTWIARTDKNVARSIYDTIFEAEVEYQDNQRKQTSTIFGSKTVDNDYNVGFSKKLPSGTTVSVDLDNNRHFTNSAFTTSPLTHDSTLGVTVEQDLGKNLFGIQDRGDVKITLIDIENSEYTSLKKIEESVSEVQKAYWDLVLQIENVRVEEAMVNEAKKLYDLHQEQLQTGLVEAAEAIASEANYKKRKNALLLAQNQVKAKNSILKLLLNIEDNIEIDPTEDFDLPAFKEQLLSSLKRAFEYRQDYKKAHNEIRSRDIKLSMEKNNLWPEINLTATLENNGLGDHFKHAVTEITEQSNPNLFAGLTITFSLENREARGQLKAAEYQKAKTLLELKLLERQITIDVTDQVRDCNVFQEVAANSKEIAQLQEKKLSEEQKRFKYGRSDVDTLIRFQEDLVQAKGGVILAVHQYHTALVDLRQKEGTLLKKYWKGKL